MKLLYTFLLVALPSLIFAQTNYHAGFVVKTNGDTLKGYIDYREWDLNPESIDFKINKDDKESKQFKPENIEGFAIDTLSSYISYYGRISMDRNHFPDLSENLDTTKKPASLFLKLVTSGSHLSLYTQADKTKTRYFVKETSDTPAELIYNQYYNKQHESVERSIFRGQLIFYVNKYAPSNTKLIGEAEQSAFENDQLAGIVYKINGDSIARINGHVNGSSLRVFLGAGLLFAQYKSTASPGTLTTFTQFSVGIDKFDDPNVQQFIMRLSISISPSHASTRYPISGSPNNNLKFDQFNFSVIPQAIYNLYNKDSFKVYIAGGVSVNFSSFSNAEFSSPVISDTSPTDPVPSFNSFWVNVPLQTGVVFNKRIEGSFTYTPYAGIPIIGVNKVSYQTFCLGVKVFLGDK